MDASDFDSMSISDSGSDSRSSICVFTGVAQGESVECMYIISNAGNTETRAVYDIPCGLEAAFRLDLGVLGLRFEVKSGISSPSLQAPHTMQIVNGEFSEQRKALIYHIRPFLWN